jgi:hypothetical protein
MTIIISLCLLLLIAYLFYSCQYRLLLLLLGYRDNLLLISTFQILPLLYQYGTIGLILIVLEGSLELELNRSKGLIKKSSIGVLPLVILAFRLRIYYNIMEDIL